MGGFFTPPPSNPDPAVPPGADAFDVATPNYRLIGQMLGSGLRDAGGLGGIASSIFDPIVKALAYLLGFILSKLLCIVAFLIDFINRVDDTAAPGMDAVARNSLAHVFGVPIGGSTGRRLASTLDAKGAADSIGRDVMQAIIRGVGQTPGTPIAPTSQPSEDFLAKITHIGIEGWLEGTITEAITLGQFEAVMQLVPIMADVLGLGRLSRRVLAPPLKILVEDPYTWKLNLDFRPTLLAHDQAVREFLRGKMDRSTLDNVLGRQGFAPSAIEALININTKLLALGDVDYLVARGHWSQAQGVQTLKDDGFDETTANILLTLAGERRLDAWDQKNLELYTAAFERGEIDQAQLNDAFNASNLPDGEKAVAEAVAATRRRLNVKHLTLAEVETLIKAHIMSLDDLRTWMTRENYPDDEQTLLELWLFGKITSADQAAAAKKARADAAATAKAAKATAAQQKQAAAAAKASSKGVSLATFEQLVELGQRTFADLQTFLQQQGETPAAIADIVDLLHAKIAARQTLQQQHDALTAEADQKHIPLSQTEKAVLAGVLTPAELDSFLHTNEYAAADIQMIEAYVQQQLDAAKAKAATKSSATAAAGSKDVSLPTLERAARLGLTTVDAYAAALTAAGFNAESRDLMVGILKDQIAADTATLAKRTAAAAAAKRKKISLPQLEAAVIAGVRPIADYQAELSALGYDSADQAALVELLQLQVDHAKDVAAKKSAAAAKLSARGLTLAELERAVKLGALSIDQYTAELAADGFSPEDVTILSTSLLAELATLKQTATRRNTISKALAKKGISLAQEEQLVKQGLATLDAYTGWLVANGYSSADAAALTALLSVQVDQAKAAAAAHAIAQQKAADKDLSLAKEEQAVMDGLLTMQDYQAYLADLGFNAIDQATLADLLAQKIGAANAKAAASSPSPPASSPAP